MIKLNKNDKGAATTGCLKHSATFVWESAERLCFVILILPFNNTYQAVPCIGALCRISCKSAHYI